MKTGTVITCRRCLKQLGHNARGCTEEVDGVTPPRVPRGRCDHAAIDVKREGASMREIARRYGITPQAVMFGWRRMFGYEVPPVVAKRAALRARVVGMAMSGMRGSQIAAALGLTEQAVYHQASRGNVSIRRRLDYSVGIQMLRDGASVPEAAGAIGVSQAALQRAAAKLGVKSQRNGGNGERDGRSKRAAELIEKGMTPGAACMVERCSITGAMTTLRRMREKRERSTGG